jgi:hypothetical protein
VKDVLSGVALKSPESQDGFNAVVGAKFVVLFNFAVTFSYCNFFYRYFRFRFDCTYLLPKLYKFLSLTPKQEICDANDFFLTAIVTLIINNVICILVVRLMNAQFEVPRNDRVSDLKFRITTLFVSLGWAMMLILFVTTDLNSTRLGMFNNHSATLGSYVANQMMKFGFLLGFINSVLLLLYLPRKYMNAERYSLIMKKVKQNDAERRRKNS